MSIIEKTLREQGGFVAYLTAGDGGMQRTKEAMLALIQGGVNIVEVGLPFSDPIADGPTIQAAAARALESGATLENVFQLIREIKNETQVPVILFTYYNPIVNAGSTFYRRAKEAGIDGCLVVDLPLEESKAYQEACIKENLDPIFLISPSTPKERIKRISEASRGMLYYVTRSGTTGVRDEVPSDLKEKLKMIKSVSSLPVVAGFGIANRDMAKAMLAYADGFVVGSLFVKAVAQGETPKQIQILAESIDPRS